MRTQSITAVLHSIVVIIGAGQAGAQAAMSLRELGHLGRIVLLGEESRAPYQRPPLSKGYLLGEMDEESVVLRPNTFFSQQRIELIAGKRAVGIERAERKVILEDNSVLDYDHLVLATGARNRPLSVPGSDLQNVLYLRTLDEATALGARLASARSVVVIGAGFVGLEFAVCAAKRGASVTVLDIGERAMSRAVSHTMSTVFAREHQTRGIRLRFNTQVARLLGEHGRVSGVETVEGRVLPADLVMIGIGVIPNTELAALCGLQIDNGIVVDRLLQTSDARVSAIGDVAAHENPYALGHQVRLESVQNACDQARCVARRLTGQPSAYDAVPWFWSYQGDLKLQMAGLPQRACEEIVRGDANGTTCSLFLFHEGKLVCVETLNRPADHMLARRLLAARVTVTPQQAADAGFDLRSLLPKPDTANRAR